MDIPRFRALLALHSETIKDIAELIGLSPSSVYRKIDGTDGEFTQSEISKIKNHYNLSPEDVDNIFFAQKVS